MGRGGENKSKGCQTEGSNCLSRDLLFSVWVIMKDGVWRDWREKLQWLDVVHVCAIQHVVTRLSLHVLCYSQSVRWWPTVLVLQVGTGPLACAYLQLPSFRQSKHRGKPKPVRHTHHDDKLMISWLPWKNLDISLSAFLFVFLFVCRLLCLSELLPDTKPTLEIQFKPASLNTLLQCIGMNWRRRLKRS